MIRHVKRSDLVAGVIQTQLIHPAHCGGLGAERADQAGASITAMCEIKSIHNHHNLG